MLNLQKLKIANLILTDLRNFLKQKKNGKNTKFKNYIKPQKAN